MIKACFFDLDGTLINSIKDLAIANNEALKACGLPPRALDENYHIVGNGVYTQIKRSLGDHQEHFDACLKAFQDYYHDHCYDNTEAYEGMTNVLEQLQCNHIKVFCITNKPELMAKEIIKCIYGNLVDEVIGGADGRPFKPDPSSTLEVVSCHHLTQQQCLFIGDTYVDIETGHNAKMTAIGCLWGFRDLAELKNAGADYIVSDPRELGELINDLYERML